MTNLFVNKKMHCSSPNMAGVFLNKLTFLRGFGSINEDARKNIQMEGLTRLKIFSQTGVL